MTPDTALIVAVLGVATALIIAGSNIIVSLSNNKKLSEQRATLVTQADKIDEAQKTITEVHVLTNSRLDVMTAQVQSARDDLHAAMLVITELRQTALIREAALKPASIITQIGGTPLGDLPVVPLTAPTIIMPAAPTAPLDPSKGA